MIRRVAITPATIRVFEPSRHSTALNAVLWREGSNTRMVAGVMATRRIIAYLGTSGVYGQAIVVSAAVFAAAVFVALGLLVRKGHVWALLVAAFLYATDTVLVLH